MFRAKVSIVPVLWNCLQIGSVVHNINFMYLHTIIIENRKTN